MGEMSDYFEDFPEENPANYVGGHFDPAGATRFREAQKAAEKVEQESNQLMREMATLAANTKKAAANRLA
jgi:hypothetical protein